MKNISKDITGKRCIIIDDIVDTAETLCKATSLLFEHGALSVDVIVTHAILSEDAINRLAEANIRKIIITNSIQRELLLEKFIIIDITPLIADFIL